ncbi:putative CoA-dependent acyltransferase [Legionella quinlivanii]|uniref:Putative CoA-dependent acyltransferase n=1 Tax=Legionella quinlivanii TaxID=45073 RepID=A0A0W0Y6Y5_9GAMM|nr:hypothetical protein [Legionella quinlivanii]KTD52618.1 putative CoA-dependent acyltransferase [Legionella quinlivanii]SEG26287.1 hypothetical protein SAMN02746093_02355 [Legionella quinlivanii DSM 21216]STY10298.1 putative CoA-dependent acyltransferase [Legionella quinlivanii]
MKALDQLLTPYWGSEKWILEGWNKITEEERESIEARVESLFKNGLPFELKHDKILYLYIFSLMAQLEVLGIQLPMRFEDKMYNPEFKKRMRAQLVDEIFHTIVFTRIVFMLAAPYGSPPAYNEELEKVCEFIRSLDCLKVGMVVMNLICEGMVEEVFSTFYQEKIAPEVFEIILADEHRHVCEADLYAEIGLPDREVLTETLKTMEDLLISVFTRLPKYNTSLTTLLGPEGTASFMLALHEKHKRQLKKINMVPSERLEMLFEVGPDAYAQVQPYRDELHSEMHAEIKEVEMTTVQKVLMTQLNNPGDPNLTLQFNIDISEFGFFEKNCPQETLTALMMQAVSLMLTSEESLRNFISFKKLHQSRSAYVAVVEKLAQRKDHIVTVFFKDCHEMTVDELLTRNSRSQQLMTYCYDKREQVEKDNPEFKKQLDAELYNYAHDLYPCPSPGSYGAYVCNLGAYGYTQAVSPLFKQTGFHVVLLAVERKPIWNEGSKSFESREILPVSISIDNRIFDGLMPLPALLQECFDRALQTMQEKMTSPLIDRESKEAKLYKSRIDKIANDLAAQESLLGRDKITVHLLNKNKLAVFKEMRRVFGEDVELYGKRLSKYSDFKNAADNLLLDYLGFEAEQAAQNANFTKIIDKILAENKEFGYRMLTGLQAVWLDYVDVEALFNASFNKIAESRLKRLAKFIPTLWRSVIE